MARYPTLSKKKENIFDIEALKKEHNAICEILEKLKPQISSYWLSVETNDIQSNTITFIDFTFMLKKHLDNINILFDLVQQQNPEENANSAPFDSSSDKRTKTNTTQNSIWNDFEPNGI